MTVPAQKGWDQFFSICASCKARDCRYKGIMDFAAIAKSISEQVVTVWHAPVPFLAAFIASWLVMRAFIRGQFETRLSNIQSTLDLRNAQLQDYKDKLSGATPEEAKARMNALEARIDEIVPRLEALGPRRVTVEQRQAMAPILDQCRGAHVSIASDAASVDAAQMVKGLLAAFNSAGWVVSTPTVLGLGNPPPSGIALRAENLAQLRPEERCVADALRTAGLEYDLQVGGRGRALNDHVAVELILTTQLHD